MRSIEIDPPYQSFAGADGNPLENGYIFVGEVNQNPVTNPIIVYFDSAQTIIAPQPIRTLNGYPVFQGSPSRFYVNVDYSIQVKDKNGNVVYTSLNGNAFPGSAGILFVNATGDGVQTVFPVAFDPTQIFISGVYQNQNTYSFNAGDVTFSEAPPLNSIIEFTF
jgi:hypothetical protein